MNKFGIRVCGIRASGASRLADVWGIVAVVASSFALGACNDATAPRGFVAPELRAPERALMIPSTTPQVSARGAHTCTLSADATVVCWGDNSYGQATVPAGLGPVAQVSAGGYDTCAIKTDGTVACWGDNRYGQTSVPAGLISVAKVSTGSFHNCALKTDGTVVCWGYDEFGQSSVPGGLSAVTQVSAGYRHTCASKEDETVICWGADFATATPVGLSSVTELASDGDQTCALKRDGTVSCWGRNVEGQTSVPAGLVSVAQVSVGFYHTCALKTDGTVVCWGYNGSGQTTVPSELAAVTQVSAGGRHTCALERDGSVTCWGENASGESTVPAGLNLNPLSATPSVSARGAHTCALKADGSVVCWGDNSYGQATVPAGLGPVAQVSAGGYDTCVLKPNRTVACWGDNRYGQATPPADLFAVAQVSTGSFHNCAVKTDATVVCWGYNELGQSSVPAGLGPIAEVSAGYRHTCARRTNGTVICWGAYPGVATPAGLSSVAHLSSDGDQTCALKTDGTVTCWGRNVEGQISVPTGLASVALVSVGFYHTCALRTDGTVVCWGYNGSGQTTVPAALVAARVTAGGRHTCALEGDGSVVCWGENGNGEATVPAGLNLTVTPEPQSITFTSTPPSPALTGGTYTVEATGGASGNPVTFSSLTLSTCAVSGSDVSLAAVGSCRIAADQAAGDGYDAAPQVTQDVEIVSSAQEITFTSSPPNPAFVGSTYTVAAKGGASGNAILFKSLTASVCSVQWSTVKLDALGSCTVAADQAAGSGYDAAKQVSQTFPVESPDQVIVFTSTPPDPGLVGSTYTVAATGGTSGNPVTFGSATPAVCSVSESVVSFVQSGTCTIDANQAGGGGYSAAAPVSQSVNVLAPQSITFTSTPPNPGIVGNSYAVSATGGGSGNPVIFSSKTPDVCSVIGRIVKLLAAGSCVVAANQAGGSGYAAAPVVAQTFIVLIEQTVTFTSKPPNKATVGGAYTLAATGGASGNPVVFSSLNSSVCSVTGSTTNFVAAGTCTIAANQNGTSTYAAASQETQTLKIR